MKFVPFTLIILIFSLNLSSYTQAPDFALAQIKKIRLLESSSSDVNRIFGESSEFITPKENGQIFSRENDQISVTYASGNCSENDWNVATGLVTEISYLPKNPITIDQLRIDHSRFKKQRTDPQRKNIFILYDKSAGTAIFNFAGKIDQVSFTPASSNYSKLCDKPGVLSYYRNKSWTRLPIEKNLIIDYNSPARVVGFEIISKSLESRLYEVRVETQDPQNDIVSVIYKVSGGKVIGSGHQVVWDLRDVAAGEYEIVVAADDGCGLCGKYVKKTIQVK